MAISLKSNIMENHKVTLADKLNETAGAALDHVIKQYKDNPRIDRDDYTLLVSSYIKILEISSKIRAKEQDYADH